MKFIGSGAYRADLSWYESSFAPKSVVCVAKVGNVDAVVEKDLCKLFEPNSELYVMKGSGCTSFASIEFDYYLVADCSRPCLAPLVNDWWP